ncbi:hypothetical protein LO771_25015 [Streptacidiphilus sp. ASG 303]|uniref:hypothetical protein n=1 Tax=Streptacidiphilus sp. ASG 303 TaxID=2896847 RepID=UPI001E5C75B0|nr:hypothetical protein [Streptacidiphilus sp. ASG 303]MCD0485557.1 hypothetical protein [Streptacidiphilus sp. ASG 303]
MSTFKRIAVTAAATVALTIGAANTASAFEINDSAASDPDSCGIVGWSNYGDIFRFMDLCHDYRGVRVQYTTPTLGQPSTSDGKHTHDYTGGYTGYTYSGEYNLDFAEGACFYFRAGLEDNGTYVSGTYGPWQLACA